MNSKIDTSNQQPPDRSVENHPHRWQVLLDVLAFQFKLALDAIRDLLLSPVSIATALFGIFTDGENPGKYFYGLLQQGHKSDRWINLFGTSSQQTDSDASDLEAFASSDIYVRKMENFVRDEYQKGGVVKNLKEKADRIFDKTNRD